MAKGSPSQSERPKRIASHARRKAIVTSERDARLTTKPPRHTTRNPKNAKSPHCPGETHTRPPDRSIMSTRAKLVGLNTCLPLQRSRNLLRIAAAAAASARAAELLRNNKHSDKPEIGALLGSNPDSPQSLEQAN